MTKTRDLSDFLIEGGADLPLGKPHIVPDVLYPSYVASGTSNKLLDGTTDHSGAFGTEQSDGRKYYYTNIAGSKPIKDPRIGAHFGSQRHKFKSLQLLEQETATHGKNVYSIDGREWCRAVEGTGTWRVNNSDGGSSITSDASNNCTGIFLEITGYFNDFNISVNTATDNANDIDISVNGTLSVEGSTTLGGDTAVGSPLGGRYVDKGSLINGGSTLSSSLGTTPAINTIRYECTNGGSEYIYVYAIELIAQDLSGSGSPNRSKIKFPLQNVVSHGKKFEITETNHHYNPFAFAENGTTAVAIGNTSSHGKLTGGWASGGSSTADHYDSTLDTTTSLGLSAWVDSGNYYRPVNGGRIVKWVDSSGNIKTSVNVMPPAARHISGGGNNGLPTGTSWVTSYQPSFMAGAIDHSQSEVAKTFHFREFGNGSANAGTGSTTYADASMLTTNNYDIAYVMDDGLTSLSADDFYVNANYGLLRYDTGDKIYFTFIGTGISWNTSLGIKHWAQNLPYGTHIVEMACATSSDQGTVKIDGVTVKSDFANSGDLHIYKWHPFDDITFHQPKKPPIPEDAVVLADYMLMADFVAVGAEGITVSKGARRVSASRDLFYDCDQAINLNVEISGIGGFQVEATSSSGLAAGDFKGKLSAFGTQFVARGYGANRRDIFVNNSDVSQTDSSSNSAHNTYNYPAAVALDVNTFESRSTGTGTGNIEAFEIATPIHTSHHYQSFETPFLHELVGGDRNMEQHNLVCSPDGKSWDQITRDTSYIGGGGVRCDVAATQNTHGFQIFTEWRGTIDKYYDGSSTQSYTGAEPWYNKNFAIAYDRLICLKDGKYSVYFQTHTDSAMNSSAWGSISKNDKALLLAYFEDHNYHQVPMSCTMNLVRGDFVQIKGITKGDLQGQSILNITQV